MKIESAIKMLEEEKEKGTQSVFIAYWTADWFGREDDEQWEEDVETAERKTDLSYAHDAITACLENEQKEKVLFASRDMVVTSCTNPKAKEIGGE